MTNLISLISPINLSEEKQKFFASPTYSPIFHYSWENSGVNPTFEVGMKYPLWEAIKHQDHEAIIAAAKQLFEVDFTAPLLAQARSDAASILPHSSGTVAAIAGLFASAFREFELDYEIVISERSGFNLRPQHNRKRLLISRDIHFDYFSMEGEVHHELVHIIRELNGVHNHVPRSERYLPTEEGLAAWCQDHTNDDNGLAQHAMEFIASAVGLSGSLRDIYNCLRDLGMSAELAWKRGSRHKFGFINTSLPGDILKPAMYYQNELLVGSLLSAERLRLFVGKINSSELPAHPSYDGRWAANLLTDYFHL